MDLNFFLRFSLQRMTASMAENQFDCGELMGLTDDNRNSLIQEYVDYSSKKGALLREKHLGGIEKLYGKKTLFIGDSLTQDRLGYRGIVTEGAKLESRSIAVSGATSADMFRSSYEAINGFKPDIISVMIGTNDAYCYGETNREPLVSKAEYRKNLRNILQDAKNSGAVVIVSTIPPMDESKYYSTHTAKIKSNNNENIIEYNAIVIEEAKNLSIGLIDLYRAVTRQKEMFEPDGIHLSLEGQLLLADMWLDATIKQQK